MADRIQARAVRRCGELLKQIEAGQGVRTDKLHDATDMKLTRTEAATQAGLSERQKVTALRVANVPQPEFERVVELQDTGAVTGCLPYPPAVVFGRLQRLGAVYSASLWRGAVGMPVEAEHGLKGNHRTQIGDGLNQNQSLRFSHEQRESGVPRTPGHPLTPGSLARKKAGVGPGNFQSHLVELCARWSFAVLGDPRGGHQQRCEDRLERR